MGYHKVAGPNYTLRLIRGQQVFSAQCTKLQEVTVQRFPFSLYFIQSSDLLI